MHWTAVLLLFVILLGLLLWAAWPRAVKGASGYGADDSWLTSPGAAPSAKVRIGTFNIHGGKGRDGRRDLLRQAEDLQGIDIAVLQEVHDSWRAPRQLTRLAARLGVATLNAPVRSRWFRRHRSNALLTRYPVGVWTRVPLTEQGDRGFHFRNLTIAQLRLRQPLWVMFTHLNRGDGREVQLDKVLQEFLQRSPAVLMGDFNMTRDDPAMRKCLARPGVRDALGEALENDNPSRIDWILYRGLEVTDAGVIDSGASDHPLYWCDIRV
ncbi:MAG: endonuclease/exonuclease/phosphatase family protein [Arenicellales bacterium]|jgi:endonuclease/exonuclease/phosphatase family metal-dependent hydrolase